MIAEKRKWFELRIFTPICVAYIILLKVIIVASIVIFLLVYSSRDSLYGGSVDSNASFSSNSSVALAHQLYKRLPQAIIIGVKKGGTRALLEYLRLHPSVKAPGPEVHYFDRNYYLGSEWYRDQMVKTSPWQTTIEKTPSYFVTKDAPFRVHSLNPNMKLIIVVRNPVTRAISGSVGKELANCGDPFLDIECRKPEPFHGKCHYTQNMSKRPGMPSFEEMAFVNGSRHGLVNTSWGAIKIGLYHKHILRWLKYFPRDRMHFVDGQRLITHPASETNLVERFLNLNSFINDKHFYINESKKFPCLARLKGSGPPRCLGKTKGRRHPEVSEFHLNKLRSFYKSHNERFFKIIQQRFDW